eukprot:353088-Chlamydomonas_euryale.AAC.17
MWPPTIGIVQASCVAYVQCRIMPPSRSCAPGLSSINTRAPILWQISLFLRDTPLSAKWLPNRTSLKRPG